MCWLSVDSASFVENAVFSPLDGFSSFVKDQVMIGVWVHFWVFNSIPLFYLPVTVQIPCSFLNHYCSVVLLEVQHTDSPRSSFTVENSFSYPGFLVIPDEFENCSFKFYEELSWKFAGYCIESVDCFWQDGHFYFINSANPWAWEIFPFSEVFFDFFLQGFEVLVIQIYHLFG